MNNWEVLITNNTEEDLSLKHENLIKQAFLATLEHEGAMGEGGELSLLLVNHDEMQSINAANRGKNATTDVLAFPQDDPVILGDIVLNLDKVKEQAEEYTHSFERELAFLTIHATLHLLGHEHENNPQAEKTMFEAQDKILQILNLWGMDLSIPPQ